MDIVLANLGIITASALLLATCIAIGFDHFLWSKTVSRSVDEAWENAFDFRLIPVKNDELSGRTQSTSHRTKRRILTAVGTRNTVKRTRALLEFVHNLEQTDNAEFYTVGDEIRKFKLNEPSSAGGEYVFVTLESQKEVGIELGKNVMVVDLKGSNDLLTEIRKGSSLTRRWGDLYKDIIEGVEFGGRSSKPERK